MRTIDESEEPAEVNINPEKVCFIIVKAREFDAKVDPVELDPVSNEPGTGIAGVQRPIWSAYPRSVTTLKRAWARSVIAARTMKLSIYRLCNEEQPPCRGGATAFRSA
jgi:hypothetical protein